MAMEADSLTQQHEGLHDNDRRARTERRGRERRRPGSRINRHAPTQSLLKIFGAYAVAFMAAIVALTILADHVAGVSTPMFALVLEGVLLGVAILLIAIGSLEQRLIEIRLELLMLNGGRRREEDRRSADRRSREPSA